MRILFVSYSPLMPGGLNRTVKSLGPMLRERGHDVAFASVGYDGCPHAEFGFDIWPVRPIVTEAGLIEIEWRGVDKAVDGFKPDRMILLGDPWTFRNLVSWRVARRDQGKVWPPALMWLTIDSAPFSYDLWQQGVLDFPEQLACTTMFGCRVLAGEQVAPWPTKRTMRYQADYLPLGIDGTLFTPEGPVARRDKRFWIGWCGRNDHRKEAPVALRALAILKERGVDAMLWMRTEAKDGYDLISLCHTLGLRPTHQDPGSEPDFDVYFLGDKLAGVEPVSDQGMAAFYRTCDVLLHTSVAGAPELPILEARACGTTVVALDAYSNAETADVLVPCRGMSRCSDVGTLLPYGDPEDYADALLAARGTKPTDKPVTSWEFTADALDLLLQQPVPDGPVGMVI